MKEIIVLMVLTLNWDMTYKFEGTVGAYNDDAQCFKKLDLIESTSSTENFEAIRAYDFYLRINDKQKKTQVKLFYMLVVQE